MTPAEFAALMQPIMRTVTGKPIDAMLAEHLNTIFPPVGDTFQRIKAACHEAIREGWMCSQGTSGRQFGRVIEPSSETGNLSVDVVDLTNIVGPHHRHPNGEVCLIMPIDAGAQLDGHGAGWCVYGPGSSHYPTVTNGRALVLYLLPDGLIEYTGMQPQGSH